MASVFWDSEGVLMIDYLERGKTVTGVYYAELIRKLRSAIKEKRRESWVTVCCFIKTMHLPTPLPWQWLQFENAASNCSGNRRIHHTWHRLTTTCSDLWKIRFRTELWLWWRGHPHDKWLFELQDKQFFVDGVNSLAHRWEKRVMLEGDNFEKL